MEINVTLILAQDCKHLSASQAELGPYAGEITWKNCLALATGNPIVTDENRDDVRDHFRKCGAWDREEIESWTDIELSALVWQEAAASCREFREYAKGDLARYRELSEAGSVCGRFWITDDGQAIFYLGC